MKRWAPAMVLAVAVIAGFALRLAPCVRNPGFEFMIDGRYHERLTRQVLATGRLAEVDSLSNAPAGRRTANHLPTGLYYAGAMFHRALTALGSRDLRWNLAMFEALAGGLIAVPVWILAIAVFRDRRAAAIAALLAVFLPAHLHRTLGITLRYDALGTLLVTAHVAFAIATLAEARPRRRWTLATLAAAAFVAAMCVWRVSLLVLQIELAYAALRFIARGADRPTRDLWWALALVGTLGLLPIPYLAEHRFLLTPLWIAIAGFGAVLAIPSLGPGSRWFLRAGALAAVAAVALALGRFESSADYAGIAGMLRAKFGLARGHDPDAALMLSVLELQGMSPARFLTSGQIFGWLGAGFVLSPLAFWWLAGRSSFRKLFETVSAPASLAFLACGLTVSTLLVQRSVVLLAPVLAAVIGGLIARASGPRPGRGVVAVLVVAAAVGAMVSGITTAATSSSRLAPNLQAAIEYLRTHAAPGAAVICDWDAGYEVQSRAGLPTAVDGLLESAENRRRIVELYAALMDPGSTRLEALCRRSGAHWLLLPTTSAIYAMASVAGDPLADVLARGEGVTRGPMTDHLIVYLIEGERSYPGLRRACESGGYTVFEVTNSSPGVSAGP